MNHLRRLNNTIIILRRPFWISPRQVVVIPVAAPYVSWTLLSSYLHTFLFFWGGRAMLIIVSVV